MKAVLFTNWTTEDFTHTWDSVPYTFPAGQSMMLQDSLAQHFAKHLATRELNKRSLSLMNGGPERLEFEAKCLSGGIVAQSATKLESEILNYSVPQTEAPVVKSDKFCELCDSKGVRHKKECPTNQVVVPEPVVPAVEPVEKEFEGLQA